MTTHAVQSVTLCFGMVAIPVKLYVATSSKALSFHLIHQPCGRRVQQLFYCPMHEQQVARGELAHGCEIRPGQPVSLTDEELQALEQEATREVSILEFVPLQDIDPLWFKRSYYLAPDPGWEQAYWLLAEAMRQRQRVGVAKIVLRRKDNLCAIRSTQDGLVMHVMHYADEIRGVPEMGKRAVALKQEEMELAMQLIDALSSEAFDHAAYHDTYRERVQELVERRVRGQVVKPAPQQPATSAVADLMVALKLSLTRTSEAKKRAARAKTVYGLGGGYRA